MYKSYKSFFSVTVFISFLLILQSCNNSGNIPFPENELGYTQPQTVPLVFSAPKKLTWDTISKTGITASVNKFDINALPEFPYDSSGFKIFAAPPEEVQFDFNKLPSKDFSLDKMPSNKLDFTTSLLGIIPTIKAGNPVLQKNKLLDIYDFGALQGMQGKFITTLFKDHYGHVWIGSREGLFRYDGEHLQTFVEGAIAGPTPVGITEDSKGNIWFINQAAVGMINLHKGTISYSNKIVHSVNGLDKMTVDKAGNIWVYNIPGKAVSIINTEALTYRNIDAKTWLSDTSCFVNNNQNNDLQIVEDDSKNIWITTMAGGINIIDAASGKIKYLGKNNGLSSDSVTAITKDSNGQIWAGFFNGSVDAIEVKNGTIKHYGKSQGLAGIFSTWLYFDDKGYLWRGTGTGIDVADIKNKKVRTITQKNGLTGDVIASLLQDNKKRIWVANTSGINIIDQNGETVHPLGSTQIISLMEDGANNLWIATQKGVLIADPERTKMHLLNKSRGLSNDFVQSFWNKNGNIVVATDEGFNIIDPIKNTLSKITKKEGLISDTVYVTFKDASGNIWVTGPSKGISLLDSAKKLILHTDVMGGLSDDAILDVKQDKNGLIWLATLKSGINIVNTADGTVKYLNNQPGLRDTCIRMMLEDKYGRMWIGTDKGIYVADIKEGAIISISTKQGLSNNAVLSLLEYKGIILAGTKEKISMITAPEPGDSAKGWKISILNKSQGIVKETNSWSTDAVTHDGKYLWGDNGITLINEMNASADSVENYITGFTILGQPQYFTSSSSDTLNAGKIKTKWDNVSGPYNLPENLSLPNTQNYLQFQFTQASLVRSNTTLYSYILEGIDKKWSVPNSNPFTENYLNLSPGKYTFKVNSKGIDGKWGKPAAFTFTITPPWYKTWWAYTVFALLMLGLLRAYIVFRSRRLQRENKVLEEKVKHRTQQLQQSLEDLKSTQSQLVQSEKMASLGELTAGIAHEIQNPLNFVNNFSEVNSELITEMKEELNKGNIDEAKSIADDINDNEKKILFHGQRAGAIVKGMLQHSRASSGQKEPTDINALADEYLRLAYHGLRAKDKSFNATMKTDFDESLSDNETGKGKINIVPQDIGRVILNLLTNAFYAVNDKKKNAPAGEIYDPTVSVSTHKISDHIEIKVADNGNGIPDEVKEKIFQPFFTTKPAGQGTGLGLSLSYDIIKAHGGLLKVESVNKGNAGTERGTTFTIQLPI
ncbi:MAG: two-component regulator propeller domain-containing protein [Ferruginibacter sp.]